MTVIDREPSWRDTAERGDGLEGAPCVIVEDTIERTTDPKQASFWAVYVHMPEGGGEWIADYDGRVDAVLFAEGVVEEFPNLNKHGIYKCWD